MGNERNEDLMKGFRKGAFPWRSDYVTSQNKHVLCAVHWRVEFA